MKSNRSTLARLLIGGLLLWSMLWIMRSYVQTNSGSREGTHRVSDAVRLSSGPTVTVRPVAIDDILYNPGMGLADFHLAKGSVE